MPIDPFYSLRPSRTTASRADRNVTLDPQLSAPTSKKRDRPRLSRRADPGVVQSLLSALVEQIEGKPLSVIIPMISGLLSDRLGISASGDFQDAIQTALYTTVGDLGRVVNPRVPPDRSHQANKAADRQIQAGSLGVTRTKVEPGKPRCVRKFDEMLATFSDGVTLAAVLADGEDGLPPGSMEALTSAVTAIRNNFLAGDREGARRVAEDLGVMLVALDQVVNGTQGADQPAQRSANPAWRRVADKHWAVRGHEVVQRAGNAITKVEDMDGNVVREVSPEEKARARARLTRRTR